MIATNNRATTTTSLPQISTLERAQLLKWLALAVPVVVSATLNFWNLAQNGYSNLYYSVAVQSMMQSFHNFFFASYDAGGFITVDKPPVALWIQTISAKIFGFNSLSLLVPEALAGIASVVLIYFLVRRVFGTFAGFVAALALALTPIAVAVERTNNTDSFLMLTLLLGAWALMLAAEKGRLALLLLALGLVGVGFNIKMLAAFVVLPAFYLFYLVAAAVPWPKRLLHLAVGSVVLFAVALSWPLAVDLTPASQRPWVGGSQRNSVLDLALNYNGLGRVTGNEGVGGGFRSQGPPPGFQVPRGGIFPNFGGNRGGGGRGGFGPPIQGQQGAPGGAGMFGAGSPGDTRLFTGMMAGQWSWLFPLALFGVVVTVGNAGKRFFKARRGHAVLLWAGWLVCYGLVFSFASGIFHPYYLIMLAPAAAALVGIGVGSLWEAYRRGGRAAWLLPVALMATAFWENHILSDYPGWVAWLTPLLLAGSVLAALGLLVPRFAEGNINLRRVSPGLVAVGLIALLLPTVAWSVTPVMAGPSNASLPNAGPEALNQNDPTSWTQMRQTVNGALVAFLEAHQDGYFYLVAVANSQQASAIALETGKPVMAAGGFMGSDPALTADKLAQMVANHEVRFVLGLGGGGGLRGSSSTSSVSGWIRGYCSAVDPAYYESPLSFGNSVGGFGGAFGFGNSQLYDCAPNQ